MRWKSRRASTLTRSTGLAIWSFEALALLEADCRRGLAKDVKGRLTCLLNEGCRRLFGDVGYKLIEGKVLQCSTAHTRVRKVGAEPPQFSYAANPGKIGHLGKQHRTFPCALVAQDDVDQMQRAKARQQTEKRDVGVA